MKVFVSSVYEDARIEKDRRHLQIRSKLERFGFWLRPELDLWMAEYKGVGVAEWRIVVDACVRALYDSDLMIVILFRRAGNPIEVDLLGPSPVSVLEIELFHASLRRLPVLFFEADDFTPEPRLAALISLLRRMNRDVPWIRASEAEIENRIIETLEFMQRERRLPARLSGFCDALSDRVSFKRVHQEISSTRLSFLSGFAPAQSGSPSLDRIDLLLAEAAQLSDRGEGTYASRLSRLWIALRDLAQQPAPLIDAKLAFRWLRLCELWTSTAAWLHLHGPLELGVLATLHTRVQLRDSGFIDDAAFPFGAFSSEAYSIAKVSDTTDWKVRRFEAARRLATKQMSVNPQDPSRAYGIRASAAMQLAQLGRPWLAAAGLLDYRQMLRTRERIGASDSKLGEAMTELGYAEFAMGRWLPWTRNFALQRLREGVALLDRDHPERRPGFVVRAKRKFAESLERGGLLDEAVEQRKDIVALQEKHGLPRD